MRLEMVPIKPVYGLYWTVVCVLVGAVLASLAGSPIPEDHSTHFTHDHSAAHGTIEVDPRLAPSVEIEVVRDVMSGWNVYLDVQNFRFAPDRVNLAPVQNEGHAHLYLDGEKLTRLYGIAYHIAGLPEGEHVFSVSLNANDHSEFTLGGVPISASVTIEN
ncbi:hypothetical protein ACOTTU_21110 [Roseobacter sp. EG26]|uniref:hypothetical protein n=1 Tax=Roseobacter sp. EG26 TaxID=3412477 RepID=UPI003CE4DEB9